MITEAMIKAAYPNFRPYDPEKPDNKKAWADTPFSLWSSKKIKALRYKAVESYNEIIGSRSKQTNKSKNEPKNQSSYKTIVC